MGRAERIELTTSRATIWRSNQLSYARHILVRLKRFELLTHGLEGRCSIQLSYRRNRRSSKKRMWSGWWESNPRGQLGRLEFYHWTTPAFRRNSPPHRQRLYIIALFQVIVKHFSPFFAIFSEKFFIYFSWAKLNGRTGENFARKCKTCYSFACLILS